MMAFDSRHNRLNNVWTNVRDDIFNEIAKRLDTTSVIRLAACSKELYHQVAGRKGSRCPNDIYWTLVSYKDVYDHKITCNYRWCVCTEPGCEFTGVKKVFVEHLISSHSMIVPRYNPKKWDPSVPVRAPGWLRAKVIGIKKEGKLFVAQIDGHSMDLILSVRPVRSATCESPRYEVRFSSLVLFASFNQVVVKRSPETMIRPSPANAAQEVLMSFLSKPRLYWHTTEPVVGQDSLIPFIIGIAEIKDPELPGLSYEFYMYAADLEADRRQ